jgi:hypothetical protein
MQKKNRPSPVYLLRCWQERETTSDQDPHWRFLVEEISTDGRRRKGFSSLSALFAFLEAELAGGEGKASK